ncbi:hypothetical protein cypCar_00037127 [Cyprinus carpio]|nr:hypothetical protein cypCar_00037127 [Cyprinus carpio]
MYIETSRPRLEGDKARLLTPSFNVAPKNPYGNVATNPTYCFSFYYHMYGKHIGTLNVYLRQKSQTGQDTSVWTLSGNQGDRWRQARVNINPTSSFQMVLEGIRGSGIEGDIAVDDVTIEEGECQDPPPSSSEYNGQEYKIPGFSRCSAYMGALSHITFGLGWPPKVTSSHGGGTQLWHS